MKYIRLYKLFPIYGLILTALIALALVGNHAVSVMTANAPVERTHTIIIDAGHGGVDGGASSCTGVLESNINLQIALKLESLLNLMGFQTKMIRTTDESVYTEGESIAAKKVSDLKNRVNLVNSTPNAVLLSIHQNHFSDSKYHGAQVFYATTENSAELAKTMQSSFVDNLNPGSNRRAKKATGVYLMQNIQCTGILIECGFLSNPEEEAMLRIDAYQKKICAVITTTLSSYLQNSDIT